MLCVPTRACAELVPGKVLPGPLAFWVPVTSALCQRLSWARVIGKNSQLVNHGKGVRVQRLWHLPSRVNLLLILSQSRSVNVSQGTAGLVKTPFKRLPELTVGQRFFTWLRKSAPKLGASKANTSLEIKACLKRTMCICVYLYIYAHKHTYDYCRLKFPEKSGICMKHSTRLIC